jgi:hypothetical protein
MLSYGWIFCMAAEWSKGRRAQLYEITRRLLKEIPEPEVVDLITIVLGYERLVTEHPNQQSYLLKFREGIDRLATHLVVTGKTGQASRLKSLAPLRTDEGRGSA